MTTTQPSSLLRVCVWLQVPLMQAGRQAAAQQLPYLHAPGTEKKLKTTSHWVVADLATPQGRTLAVEAVK